MKKIVQLTKVFIAWIASFIIAILVLLSLTFGNKRKAWQFWLHAWSRLMLKIVGVKYVISGKENLKGPAILTMNHQSLLDIFLLPAISPGIATFLAKKEVSKIPLISWVMKSCGCVFVDRKNTHKAIESIKEGLRNLPPSCSIIMFPEGTRSRNFKLLPIKKGIVHIAIQSRLPIITVGQYGMEKIGGGSNNLFFETGTVYLHVKKAIDTSSWSQEKMTNHLDEIKLSFESAIEQAKRDSE